MPNILNLAFNLDQTSAPIEFSKDGGATWTTLTTTGTGTSKTASLGSITKGVYAIGQLVLRAVGYPGSAVSNTTAVTVLNNRLPTPVVNAGNASGTSSGTINVTVSSNSNAAAYRLLAGDANAGPFTQLYQGTTANFPHTGLAASQTKYYEWQYVGGVGTFYDDSFVSQVFSGATLPPAAFVITPAASDYTRNTINGAASSLTGQRSPFARLYVNTDATSVTITQNSTVTAANEAMIGILSGTALVTSVSTDTTGTTQTLTVTLPGTGQRVLRFLDGPTKEIESLNHTVGGTTYSQLSFAGGTNATIQAQPVPASALVWIADSIGSGFAPTNPDTESITPLLESLLGYPVSADAWGSRAVGITLNTSLLQDACVTRVAAVLNVSGISLKQVWIALGINDYFGYGGTGNTSALVRSNLAAFVGKLIAAIPGVKIWVETPKYTTQVYNAQTTISTETFAGYTTALQGVTTDQPSAASVAGLSMYDNIASGAVGATLSADNVHPNTLGHSQYAQRAFNIINAIQKPYVLGTTFLRIAGSDTFTYSEFTTCLAFDANAAVASSNGQLVVHGYNDPASPSLVTTGVFAVYVNGGQVRAFITNGTIPTSQTTDLVTIPCPTSGRVTVIFSGSATLGLELRVNGVSATLAGHALGSGAGIQMAIGATPTAATGAATQGNNLNCPITNFSFFKRVLTSAEKDSIMAGAALLPSGLSTDPALLSYSRLIPVSSTSTSILDAVTNTYRYQVLQATTATVPTTSTMAAAVFTPSAGATFTSGTLTRTSSATGSPDVWGICTQQIFKGTTTGLQGTVIWGTRNSPTGSARTILATALTTAEAGGASGAVPCFYADTATSSYNIIKNPTPGFVLSPSPAYANGTVLKTMVYTDRVEYYADGVLKYTETYAVVFPLIPKLFIYDTNVAVSGVQVSGYLQPTV